MQGGATSSASVRLATKRGKFASLERRQTSDVPVGAAWAAFVVVAVPPLFGFR